MVGHRQNRPWLGQDRPFLHALSVHLVPPRSWGQFSCAWSGAPQAHASGSRKFAGGLLVVYQTRSMALIVALPLPSVAQRRVRRPGSFRAEGRGLAGRRVRRRIRRRRGC